MANTHAPLQSLAPVKWDELPQDDLAPYVNDIFAQAMIVVESIPSPSSAAAPPTSAPTGRARAKTESAVLLSSDTQRARAVRQPPASLEAAAALRKDWKEVKINPRDNPLAVSVYKLSSKDGKGAWFARQSVHEGLSFENWRAGMEREFAESLKVQGSPGVGNIRGIGADRHVEDKHIANAGDLSVFQLSAQFPGPTSPRDFITLLITSDLSHNAQSDGLRQYVIVSKPCIHSECPPRQGYIRGEYESVEIIREIHVDPSMAKRSFSATDLAIPEDRGAGLDIKSGGDSHRPVAIEWLMVTRSDPGGSVPRFLIEKGTPPGIVGDAGKFLKWVTSKSRKGWDEPEDAKETAAQNDTKPGAGAATTATPARAATAGNHASTTPNLHDEDDEPIPSSTGLYGIITGIFGAATSVVSNGLGLAYASSDDSLSTLPAGHTQPDDSDSDASSVRSFLSAIEKRLTQDGPAKDGTPSEDSQSTSNPAEPRALGSSAEKELRKLQERRRKIDEKMTQTQARLASKTHGDRAKDEASLAKLREKLDKEAAKQEAKYQRELQKIDEKRENEAKKAERKRRKTAEREEKSSMALELERTRAERDLAQQHNRILEGQVRELQAQNTQLVAKLGKLGGMGTTSLPERSPERTQEKQP